MKKREFKKLTLKRSSVADLSKCTQIKGGGVSRFCPSENEECDDPTAINCPTDILTCTCW
ncbi:hypothetical protein [Ascidiimonas aurantiaca]|uniref:hypothetical protein n=1 Tax=Ascidiimonas aurantiaca TaxID=1685432 RepID=UPI0030ED7CBF